MLIRPDLPAGTTQGQERVRLGFDATLRCVLSRVPVEQRMVPGRGCRALRSHLRTSTSLVGGVSWAIEAPSVCSRLDQHQVAARVRRPVRDAVQDGVDVYARTELRRELLFSGALDDLGHGEVQSVGMLSMQEGSYQPHLVGHLHLIPDSAAFFG